MTNNDKNELEFPAQRGSESVQDNTQSISRNDDSVIHPRYDSREIFKTVVEKIYASKEAAVREPLSNSVTACLRAKEMYDVDPLIEVTLVTQSGGDRKLEIKDNGVGMSEDLIRKVLRWIGKSTARNEGSLSGNFGLGFMACYMLVGVENAFEMHTHSRRDGDEPVSGVWQKYGKFEFDDNEVLAGRMGDDEYGTKLVFPGIKSDISDAQIYDWVERHSKWSRVPVIFKHVNDGELKIDEEYGTQTLEDTYDEDSTTFVFENEYYKAVASPDANHRILLLDTEISYAGSRYDFRNLFSRVPWPVDIRLKREDGVIVSGPNEGAVPVQNEGGLELSEDAILAEQMEESDVRLPKPTGTRDTLSSDNEEFWEQVCSNLIGELEAVAADAVENIKSISDVHQLDKNQRRLITHVVSNSSSQNQSRFDDYNVSISQQLANELTLLSEEVTIIDSDTDISNGVDTHFQTQTRDVGDFLITQQSDESVYMAVSPSQARADVIWEDSEENTLILLDDQSEYEQFEQLGWKKLRTVTSKSIDKFDVSEETASQLREFDSADENEVDIQDREITLTTRRVTRTGEFKPVLNRHTITVEDIENTNDITGEIDKFVLFAPSTSAMISDNYWVTNETIAAINCPQSVYDHLIDKPNVVDADTYINDTTPNVEIVTQEGVIEWTEFDGGRPLIFHTSTDTEMVENLQEPTLLTKIDNRIDEIADLFDIDEDPLYSPVSIQTLSQLTPSLKHMNNVYVVDDSATAVCTISEVQKYYSDNKLFDYYTSVVIDDFEGTDLYDWVKNGRLVLDNNEKRTLLDYLKKANRDEISLNPSEIADDEIEIWTADGMRSLHTVCENSEILLHVVSSDVIDMFEQAELVNRFIDYIIENASLTGWDEDSVELGDPSKYTYVPVSPSKAEEICGIIDDITIICGDTTFYGGDTSTTYSIPSETKMYAYARFEDWESGEFHTVVPNSLLEASHTKQLINALEYVYEQED